MDVMNCRGCGRLFNQVSSRDRFCPACKAKVEEKFQEVKEFLEENPNSSIIVVSQECDVSEKQIKEWVKQERLVFAEGSAEGVPCEMCGATIRTGRFCNECKGKLTNDLQSIYAVEREEKRKKTSDGNRMRFLQNL